MGNRLVRALLDDTQIIKATSVLRDAELEEVPNGQIVLAG
jgi:hypothetical protein